MFFLTNYVLLLQIRDECIVVDQDDHITGLGHGSKKEVHTFTSENPRGVLHRAFSVFIFNEDGKLLLQQRASDKITFPSVWTNTCCRYLSPSDIFNLIVA